MTPRILVWDLENSPALGYFYGRTYNTNIAKVAEPSRVMSFAASWLDDKKIEYRSDFHDGHDTMIARAWELLDQADAVVSYNGARHDTPHMKTEFIRVGAGIPSPYKEIDLYKVAKSLAFQSNRLDFVSQDLGIGQKIKHEGIDLWLACMAGDEKAWARFRKYNIEDVRLTKVAYQWLLPAMPASMLPNANLFDGEGCPSCGGANLQRRGFTYTAVTKFQRYRCLDCGQWSRGKRAVESADLRGAA